MFNRLKIFIEKHVVQDVPAELEFCEFGCTQWSFSARGWAACANCIIGSDEAAVESLRAQEDFGRSAAPPRTVLAPLNEHSTFPG